MISAAKGYWRASPTATKLLKCPLEKGCVGGSESGVAGGGMSGSSGVRSTSGSTGGGRRLTDTLSSAAPGCATGYEGPLCAVCAEGYYLERLIKECVSCKGTGGGSQLAILILVPLVMLIVGVVASIFRIRQGISSPPSLNPQAFSSHASGSSGQEPDGNEPGSSDEEGGLKPRWSAKIPWNKILPKVRSTGGGGW